MFGRPTGQQRDFRESWLLRFSFEQESILVLTLVVAADSAANRVDSGATRIYAESLRNPEVDPKQAQNHPKIEID